VSTDGDEAGPLCEPVTVQVEFWKLVSRAAGTDVVSVRRAGMRTDGAEDRTVDVPAGRDACTGVLVVVHTGRGLSERELPEEIGRPDLPASEDLDFDAARVAAHELLPPTDPTRCGVPGTPADEATPTPNPWGSDHP
jgi:hypothetical protein